ncbi:MAG: glycosyltransferase [Desulfobulbaceae bacterium]|nr:glycosyltransferase [Desulfobulbaceae bacterium]
MTAIKIVHLTSVHSPFDTRIFQKECIAGLRGGFNVVLVVSPDLNEKVDGIVIRGAGWQMGGRFSRMLVAAWKVYNIALKENGDLYHIHDPELLPWAQLLRLKGKAVIFDMHENLPKAILSKGWVPLTFRSLFSFIARMIEHLLLTGIPVIFAENSYVKDYLWVSDKVVILNMPDVDHLDKITDNCYQTPTVGYMGIVAPERGSITTLKAITELRKKGFDLHYECIGPIRGNDHQNIFRNMSEHERKSIRLRGYMKPQEGWKIIKRCHIGLAVLHAVPNYVESYPTKMFEYMALGLPVIVSDFPLYRKIIDKYKCGICVDPQDVDSIALAIQQLIENKAEALAMGKRGKKAVFESFNWGCETKKLLHFYEKILGY